jgi:hypothetical protein
LLPKESNKDKPSVRDDSLCDAVIADNVGYVEPGILSDPVCRGYGYEVGRLSQAVHNDPYRVIPTQGARQTHNEVHVDVFPFPLGNAQWLQVSGGSQMTGLDSSTGVTLGHIFCYLSLHPCPPKHFLQILIHLVGSWMDRIP